MAGRVLVTGANGFLGRHLVAELVRRGHTVRALLRPGTAPPFPAEWNVEYCEFDLGQQVMVKSLPHLAQNCEAIIHAAALAKVNPARNPQVYRANVRGTINAIWMARKAPIKRFIYVGTANVFGFGTRKNPGDETRPFNGRGYGLDYMDSKVAASKLVLRAIQQEHLPAVLVHPTFMLGPGDAKPTSNALLLELYHGHLPGYPPGGKNYVHVRDVAVATVNALSMGRVGESYILGNKNLNYREAFALIAGVLGVAPPRWPIPPGAAKIYGQLCDVKTWLTGRPAQLNAAMAAVANDGHYFTAQKAVAELALTQTSIAHAVAESFAWFKTHHYV